jgi:hypothetical protein
MKIVALKFESRLGMFFSSLLCPDQGLRRVDNIKMDVLELECGDVDWIDLAQDRSRWRALVNSVLNLRVP